MVADGIVSEIQGLGRIARGSERDGARVAEGVVLDRQDVESRQARLGQRARSCGAEAALLESELRKVGETGRARDRVRALRANARVVAYVELLQLCEMARVEELLEDCGRRTAPPQIERHYPGQKRRRDNGGQRLVRRLSPQMQPGKR